MCMINAKKIVFHFTFPTFHVYLYHKNILIGVNIFLFVGVHFIRFRINVITRKINKKYKNKYLHGRRKLCFHYYSIVAIYYENQLSVYLIIVHINFFIKILLPVYCIQTIFYNN